MGYRVLVVSKHPKGWLEGSKVLEIEASLISEALEELSKQLGHLTGYGDVELILIQKEK